MKSGKIVYGTKPKAHTEVDVIELPKCDFCDEPAQYDGKTQIGPWAYMCQRHFTAFGVGLGLGRGQRLVLKENGKAKAK
jgi:hypothetical protein